MFSSSGDMVIQIGKRNIEAVCQILEDLNIPITGEDLEKIMAGPWSLYRRRPGQDQSYKKGRNLYKIIIDNYYIIWYTNLWLKITHA